MFETIKQNIQKYALLRAAVYIISGIAIVLNPSAVFHFIGYLITAYLVLLGLLNRFYPADSSWISCYHQQLVPVVLQHEYKS